MEYALGPMLVLGGGGASYALGTPVALGAVGSAPGTLEIYPRKVAPVILHGVVSPKFVTGVTLQGVVSPE